MTERAPAPDDGWAWFFHGLHAASARRRRPFDPDTLARLARARRVIDQALADELRLDDLAREACYSPFHFLRLFQAAYAETPHRYLTARRLREARRLLATTERPVGEVCRQVGFKSVGTFSRTFASAVGEPPTAYRRRVFPIVPLIRPIPACYLARFA